MSPHPTATPDVIGHERRQQWLAQAVEELNAEQDPHKRALLFAEVEALRSEIAERE